MDWDCFHPWDAPGQHTGEGCQALLQGIFPPQESNPQLLRWQLDPLPFHDLPDTRLTLYVTCQALNFLGDDPSARSQHKVISSFLKPVLGEFPGFLSCNNLGACI